MGAAHGKMSEDEISKGRKILHKLGHYLRRDAGIPEQREEASLGIVRLDYDYPAAPGDIDHPGSFGYRVRASLPRVAVQQVAGGRLWGDRAPGALCTSHARPGRSEGKCCWRPEPARRVCLW